MKTRPDFNSLFQTANPIIGMIHIGALPGTPGFKGSMNEILDAACLEAEVLQSGGIDAIMIENMHDVPYLNRQVGPEITAAMSVLAATVKGMSGLPLGIQILAGANKEALAAALAGDADFIRAEGFVYAHVADEGIISSDAGELLRYRRQIGADHILVFTDIKKKHSAHALTADVDIAETAITASFFGSDGLILTGIATGREADPEEVRLVSSAVDCPVLIGSGINPGNLSAYWNYANGFIIGSWLKKDGKWQNPPDPDRIELFMNEVERLRGLRGMP